MVGSGGEVYRGCSGCVCVGGCGVEMCPGPVVRWGMTCGCGGGGCGVCAGCACVCVGRWGWGKAVRGACVVGCGKCARCGVCGGE